MFENLLKIYENFVTHSTLPSGYIKTPNFSVTEVASNVFPAETDITLPFSVVTAAVLFGFGKGILETNASETLLFGVLLAAMLNFYATWEDTPPNES